MGLLKVKPYPPEPEPSENLRTALRDSEPIIVSVVQSASDTQTRDISVDKILQAIRTGGNKLKDQITRIRNRFEAELAFTQGDLEKAKRAVEELKKALPGVMWSGRFSNREKPVSEKLIDHSGFLCADLDSLGDQLPEIRKQLEESRHVFALFLSPTGGLKLVVRVPADASKHLGSFRAAEKHVKELTGIQIDPACKDVGRLCFLSHDPGLYVNFAAFELEPLPLLEKPQRPRPFSRSDKPDREQIREMLAFIPKRPDYSDWIEVVAAVGDALSEKDAIEVLNEWSPEEKEGEYAAKLQSGFTEIHVATLFHLAREHGWKPTEKETVPGEPEVEELPWSDPQPLPDDLPAVLPFNSQCLPEALRDSALDISERMQCPLDFPAIALTIAAGSLVGRKLAIRPKRQDDWAEIATFWGGFIGRPGLLKTPAMQASLAPWRRLSAGAFDRYEQELHEHKIYEALHAARKKINEDELKKLLKEGLDDEAREKASEQLAEEKEAPICRRYEVNDVTIPKLGEILQQNEVGVGLVRDELVGLFREYDREDHAGDRAKLLEMWDGKGSFTYDRIGRGTVRVQSNTLSILGTMQPDTVVPYVRSAVGGGAGNDGLIQRMQLLVWPDVNPNFTNVDRWPDKTAKERVFELFKYLDELRPQDVDATVVANEIPFLHFTHEAQDAFNAWRIDLEHRLRSGDEHPAFESHLAKMRKTCPTLALLIHLCEKQTGAVGLSAYKRGELWLPYLESHARRIYSAVLHSELIAARELAKHLLKGDLSTRFSLREVYRRGWAGINSKEDASEATEILYELNWIRQVVRYRLPGTVGQPESQRFEVNPKIRSLAHPITVSSVSDQYRVYENFQANIGGNSVSSVGTVGIKDILTNSVSSVSNREGVVESDSEILKDPTTATDRTDTTEGESGVDL